MAEDGAALKGLRLVTVNRGSDGYGFHMYTNKTLRGQYIKWVSPEGPAHLSGVLAGDHVLEVDGINVEHESHQKVVELIRQGSGRDKKLLLIDQATEREMQSSGAEINPADAVVMIPRTLSPVSVPPPPDSYPTVPAPTRSSKKSSKSSKKSSSRLPSSSSFDETDGPTVSSPTQSEGPVRYTHGGIPGAGQGMGGAIGTSYDTVVQKTGKKSERAKVKQARDWRANIDVFNNL